MSPSDIPRHFPTFATCYRRLLRLIKVICRVGVWLSPRVAMALALVMSCELVGIVETYRTAKVTIPEMKDRVLEIPVPGETTLVPASVILQFMQDFGLSGRLGK